MEVKAGAKCVAYSVAATAINREQEEGVYEIIPN